MSLAQDRQHMIEDHLQARGIGDARVLQAMAKVPRERLIAAALRDRAYDDRALPIEAGQTISQPYIVALTAQALALSPQDRVLEIGTGSGYAAAIYAELVREVYTVERHAELADGARRRLAELGYRNIAVRCGDGTRGWPEHAPYQAIAVAAAGAEIPAALLEQLAPGGRLIMPVGGPELQHLLRVTRLVPGAPGADARGFVQGDLGAVQFVPLVAELPGD